MLAIKQTEKLFANFRDLDEFCEHLDLKCIK